MAYRRPVTEHHERAHRHQTRVARYSGFVLLALMLGLAFVFADRSIPPQHLPWKPLRLSDPVGVATGSKVAHAALNPDVCRQVLSKGGVGFSNIPDRTEGGFCEIKNGLVVSSGLPPLKPAPAVMSCQQALAYSLWVRQVVQPAAKQLLGAEVASIDQYGTY